MDVRQSTPQTAGSSELWHRWSHGLTATDDRQLSMPGAQPYSFLSDCECPDDCLRDHENE